MPAFAILNPANNDKPQRGDVFKRVDKYLGENLARFAIANVGDFVEGVEPGI